jgi:hypothetical protein
MERVAAELGLEDEVSPAAAARRPAGGVDLDEIDRFLDSLAK